MIGRLADGLLWGLVVFWAGATFWLRAPGGVPDAWLPAALAGGVVVACTWRRRATDVPEAADRAPTWSVVAFALVLVAAFVPLCHGALATASRHWDGAASFDAKVLWLADAPTLQQPFFAAPEVFHHSPDYPLLLPLATAMLERIAPGCGRLTMPVAWLLLGAVLWSALRRCGTDARLCLAAVAGLLLTPMLLTPGGGAVDSGYSELPLLLATTVVAAGLLEARASAVALGCALLVASKPEGLPYAGAALAIAFVFGRARLLLAAACATSLTLWLWAPVQDALLHRPPSRAAVVPLAVLALGFLLALVDRVLRSRGVGWRGRATLLALPLVLGFVALPWLAPTAAPSQGALAVYLQRGANAYQGLANLPAWLGSAFDFAFARLRYGLAPLLLVAVGVHGLRTRLRPDEHTARLCGLLTAGLLVTALPFVLSPEADLEHHLRSSLPRLLLHWVGPLWLLLGVRLDRSLVARASQAARPRRHLEEA